MLILLLDFSFLMLFFLTPVVFRYFEELLVFDFFEEAVDGEDEVEEEGKEEDGLQD